MPKKILLFVISLFFVGLVYGQQNPETTVSLGLTGQIVTATDFKDNIFLNFGGPSIKYDFNPNFSVSYSMYPSLRYNFKLEKFMPLLGTGFQLYFNKKYVVQIPLYYIDNQWLVGFGLGLRTDFLTKKVKK